MCGIVAIGEIGLSGELRSVGQIERRLAEAERLGFGRCVLPTRSLKAIRSRSALELVPCDSLQQALQVVLNYRGHWSEERKSSESGFHARNQRSGKWKRESLSREAVFE